MKLTKSKLKNIIKEELQKVLHEALPWLPTNLPEAPQSPYEPEWDEDSPFDEAGRLTPGRPAPPRPRRRFDPEAPPSPAEPGPVPWPVPEEVTPPEGAWPGAPDVIIPPYGEHLTEEPWDYVDSGIEASMFPTEDPYERAYRRDRAYGRAPFTWDEY